MARRDTNYEIGQNKDKGYGIGAGASQYGGGQRTPYQQGRYENGGNGKYEWKEGYEQSKERYPIGFNSGTQERYSEKGQSRIKPYEDAFSLTFCSRCRAIRQKNSLCTRCGGL